MPIGLVDYELRYVGQFDSLTFGQSGATVPAVDLVEIRGLFDSDVRIGDREFAREHGDVPGLHRAEYRDINLKLEIRSNTLDQAYYDLIQQVRGIFTPQKEYVEGQGIFYFKFPGEVEKMCRARAVRRREPREARTEYGVLPMEILLRAPDPRHYTSDFTDSGSQTGTFNVTNNGDNYAYPELHFGAISAVTVTNNTNGDVLDISGATNGSGNLRANMDRWIRGITNDLIIERGSNDNYFAWQQPRKPFRLSPGVNSITVTAATQVFHRDTWL